MDQSIDLLGPALDVSLITSLDELIEEHAEAAFVFLEQLVAAQSTVGQEQGAEEVLAAELANLGFDVERRALSPTVAELPGAGVPVAPYEGRYNIVARRRGVSMAPSLILNGHIDVVPADEPQLWTTPPFSPSRREGWLYGRGAGDMKCGFAMGVLALRAVLASTAATTLGDLTVVAAIEEECTGNGTLDTVAAGILADAAVLLEPTDLELLVGGIGILWMTIEVEGMAAHAEAGAGGVNAIEAMLPLLPALREAEDELNAVGDPRIGSDRPFRVNLGRIKGGDWPSSVPSASRLEIRVGFPPTWEPAEAERLVRRHLTSAAEADAWLSEHPPIVTASGFRAHGYGLASDDPLALALARAHRDVHGRDPRAVTIGSTTDARSYIGEGGIPAICYGPRTVRIHGIDEAVELRSIVDGARVLSRFLAAWPHSSPSHR